MALLPMPFDIPQILVSVLLFGAIAFAVWAVFRYPAPVEPAVHRQIAAAVGVADRETVFENPVIAPVFNLALAMSRRLSLRPIRDTIRQNLITSGNPNSYSTDEYLSLCLVCAALLSGLSGLVVLALLGTLDPLVIGLMALAGFFGPVMALRDSAKRRMMRISKKLPYTLDLIALMMAAGSTFTEAVEAIIRDEPDDDFNQELRIVQAEIEFGTSRSQALSNLGDRVPLDSLRSIVGAVNQAEALGTPLSTILKSQSGMLRMHRSVRAEKLSASASLRILVPSMLILLAVVLIVFGPMIVRISVDGWMGMR